MFKDDYRAGLGKPKPLSDDAVEQCVAQGFEVSNSSRTVCSVMLYRPEPVSMGMDLVVNQSDVVSVRAEQEIV